MERSSVGLASCDRFSSHLDRCVSHAPFMLVSRFCAVSVREWAFLAPDGGLLSGPVAPFLEETIEVPMRVRSFTSPGSSHPGCHGSLSRVSTLPVWSPGWFWLLGAGIRTVSPVLSLASSHSGVCAKRVGVHTCSLSHCGAPCLIA